MPRPLPISVALSSRFRQSRRTGMHRWTYYRLLKALSLGACFSILTGNSQAQSTASITGSSKILPPQFDETRSSIDVLERTPVGTVIMNMTARDPQGGDVTFSIRTEAYFKLANIRRNTVDIVVNSLIVFSKTQSLDFEVTASTPAGGPSIRKVIVNVIDINDNAPVFVSETKNLVILQHTAIGTTYSRIIRVTDRDSGKNADQVITCNTTLTPACAFFNITFERNGEGDFSASITVAADLSYEVAQSYTLAIQSRDQGIPSRTTTENFLITIQDTEGIPPVFDPVALYTVFMLERLPIGSNVANVTAWDGDTGIRRPVNITIFNDALGLFDIAPLEEHDGRYTSALYTKAVVIRENVGSNYSILLKATELAVNETGEEALVNSTSLVGVKFIIAPTNNYPPRCDRLNRTVVVSSLHVADRVPGVVVHCTDKDAVPYNAFNLRIVNDTGILKLSQEQAQGEIAASLVVINEAALAEAPGTSRLICISAEEDIGNVQQRKNFSDSVCVTIIVNDTGASRPVFDSSFYQATIDVSAAQQIVITVHATDTSGDVTYSLIGPESQSFYINATSGQVTLRSSLTQSSVSLIGLQAVATNRYGRSAYADLQVILNRGIAVSFQPSFYSTRVLDNSTVMDPAVRLKMTGSNADKLRYAIVNGNINGLFTIDALTGVLSLSRPIRWFDGRQTSLRVSASDERNRFLSPQDEATVEITVVPQNLNSPTFNSSLYTVSIGEDLPVGSQVTKVVATDGDDPTSPYGQVTYLLRMGNANLFRINPNDGTISLITKLDQRTSDNINVVVLAQDGGNPPRGSLATVSIYVVPSYARPPAFKQTIYVIEINEDAFRGYTKFAEVEATVPLSNVTIKYGIDKNSFATNRGLQVIAVPEELKNMITINETNGFLFFTRAFNNTQDITQLKFKVTALATNGQISTADVQINIRSGAGKLAAPVFFNQPWIRYVDNRILANITEQLTGIATKLVAVNPASNSIIATFRKTVSSNNDPYDLFTISDQGEVWLTKSVEVDALSSSESALSLLVEAIGETNLTSTADVMVSILRSGTSIPKFVNDTFSCQVMQNAAVGSRVCTVAINASSYDNWQVGLQYSVQGLHSNHFYIDQQGTVRVSSSGASLGRNVGYNYNLLAIAGVPSGAAATAKLVIKVEATNLNSPVCAQDSFNLFVSVDTKVGSIVGSVLATDVDYGQQVSYQSADSTFTVNSANGDISLLTQLPQRQLQYSFAIIASDNGNPSKQTACSVTVSTLLLRSYADSFALSNPGDNSVIYRSYKTAAGTCITRFSAINSDENVYYRLASTPDAIYFYISNASELCLSRSVNVREGSFFELVLVAQETGSFVTRRIRVQFEDQPAFDQCLPETLAIVIPLTSSGQTNVDSDNSTLGSAASCSVGNVTIGRNQTAFYGIAPCDNSSEARFAADLFWINSTSGEIGLAKPLNITQEQLVVPACVYIANFFNPAVKVDMYWWNTRKVLATFHVKSSRRVKFSQSLYTAVLTADVPVSTAIISVRQNDFSQDNSYSMTSMRFEKNGSVIILTDRGVPLRIDNRTGIVYSTLGTYLSYVGGWFNVTMLLKDESGVYNDSATLVVYVAQPRSQLVLVFGPSFNKSILDEFYRAINVASADNRARYMFITEKVSNHVDPQTLLTYLNMTDVFVRVIDLTYGRLLTLKEEIDLFSGLNSSALADLLARYPGLSAYLSNSSMIYLPANISWPAARNGTAGENATIADSLHAAPGGVDTWESDDSWLWWIAIAAALVLFVEAVIISVCLCCVWSRYRGYSSRIYDIRLHR